MLAETEPMVVEGHIAYQPRELNGDIPVRESASLTYRLVGVVFPFGNNWEKA